MRLWRRSLLWLPLFTAAAQRSVNSGPRTVLIWKRSGGIAGFCDELTVLDNGGFIAASCKPDGGAKSGALPKPEAARLEQWRKSFKPISIANRDAGLNDSMSETLDFHGIGKDDAADSDRKAMLEWASKVYARSLVK
jgi:hypothetical protein